MALTERQRVLLARIAGLERRAQTVHDSLASDALKSEAAEMLRAPRRARRSVEDGANTDELDHLSLVVDGVTLLVRNLASPPRLT